MRDRHPVILACRISSFAVLALLGGALRAGEKEAPAAPAASAADRIATPKGDLVITPINHATFALRWSGKTVIVDPVGDPAIYKDLPAPDIILITDIHPDHLEARTVKALARPATVLVLPKAAEEALLKADASLGSLSRKVLGNGEKTSVAGIGIEALPAYNTTPERKKFHEKGRGNGYILDLAGARAYISGDTEDIPEMRALRKVDVAFLCMNLPYTMTIEQAASAVLAFKPKVVYPYHSRGQDTSRFKALVEEKAKDVEVRLRDWYPKR